MQFGSPHARNPINLLGSSQASTVSCKFTIYNPSGGVPYSSTDTVTVLNGSIVGTGGNPAGGALASDLFAQSGGSGPGAACPSSFTTTAAYGGGVIESGAQGVGELVGVSGGSTGLYEFEPVVVAGGAIILLLALAMKGVEWVRRIIDNVTESEAQGGSATVLQGYTHPHGRAATVVAFEEDDAAEVLRFRCLGTWSMDQCDRAGVQIVGTMDDFDSEGAF